MDSPGFSRGRPLGHIQPQAFLLPYLEQSPLYNSCNFNWCSTYDVGYSVNSTATLTVIQSLLCPSDALAGRTGINSYLGSMGPTTDTQGWLSPGFPSSNMPGIFSYGSSASIAAVTDGTSNTIAFSESLVYPDGGSVGLNQPYRGSATPSAANPQALAVNVMGLPNFMTLINADLQTCNQAFQAGGSNLASGNLQPAIPGPWRAPIRPTSRRSSRRTRRDRTGRPAASAAKGAGPVPGRNMPTCPACIPAA